MTPLLWRHVLWRDESQLWLVARASGSFSELLQNMNYENRPILWFLVIWPFARLSANPEAMKVANWVAAAASAVIITRWLPLFRLEQLAVLGGFLFLLGYSTVTSGYMAGTAFLLLWLVAYDRRRSGWQFVPLGLMAAIHLLFALVAVPLFIVSFLAWRRDSGAVARRRRVLAMALLSATLIAISFWLIVPPSDYGFFESGGGSLLGRVTSLQTARDAIDYLSSALVAPGVAMPRFVNRIPWQVYSLVVGVIVAVGIKRAGASMTAPAVGLLLIVANGTLGYGPYWWHSGTIIVMVIVTVVMTRSQTGRPWATGAMRWQAVGLWLVLGLQVITSFSVPGNALWGSHPYSGSKEAASMVRAACPRGCIVVTDIDFKSAGVSAYLGGQSLHQLNAQRDGTFTVWTRDHEAGEVSWPAVAAALAAAGPNAVAVLSELRNPPTGFEVLGQTTGSSWPDEDFLVVRGAGE
jgi:hypothetical protein